MDTYYIIYHILHKPTNLPRFFYWVPHPQSRVAKLTFGMVSPSDQMPDDIHP